MQGTLPDLIYSAKFVCEAERGLETADSNSDKCSFNNTFNDLFAAFVYNFVQDFFKLYQDLSRNLI